MEEKVFGRNSASAAMSPMPHRVLMWMGWSKRKTKTQRVSTQLSRRHSGSPPLIVSLAALC